MIKIEMVHNEALLGRIRDLCEARDILGFTTMSIHSACGPVCGLYAENHMDSRYYTFILSHDEQGRALIQQLQETFANDNLFIFTSPITLCE